MKRSKKAGAIIGGGILTFALCAFGYGRAVNTLPEFNIPSPKMPNPNAFDFFVKAGNAIQDDKSIQEAISAQPKFWVNPHLPPNPQRFIPPSLPKKKIYSAAEKESLVAQNTEAVRLLREGFAYPYLNLPVRASDDFSPNYSHFRGLAQLLRLKGQVEATQGKYDSAIRSWLDAMQMGQMIPHGSPLIGMLVGIACEAIGRNAIWEKGIEPLSLTQAKDAINRLESILKLHFSFADTLQEEKWFSQSSMLQLFKKPDWKQQFVSELGDEDNGRREQLSMKIALTFAGKGRIFRNITGYLDTRIAQARLPYALHLALPPMPSDPMSQIVLPVFAQARIKEVESETQNRLLLVALALHAYHEEKHAYPVTLAELSPAYLKRLPEDLFALSGGFRYRRDGAKFLLYSVGPDGKDDGGNPIDDPEKSKGSTNSRARYNTEENSLGDMVVGVNTH